MDVRQEYQLTLTQQHRPLTKIADCRHIVADKQDRATASGCVMHLTETFLLKFRVAHSKDFVHDQDFWFQMGSDRKGESHIHTAAVAFHWRIEEFFDFSERNDLVKLCLNLGAAHPEDRTIQIDVLASGQFRVEAGADFKQAGHATLDADPA